MIHVKCQHTRMIEVIGIPALKDNYIWLLKDPGSGAAAVVDPGDAKPVLAALEKENLRLTAILITHHHGDHCAGVFELYDKFKVPVYGPQLESIPGCTHPVGEGASIFLEALKISFKILDIPGHTIGHIAYVGENLLFSGDTLFTGGCGRLFEGTAEQMFNSLSKLKRLPPETKLYCGHEYTLANLKFALTLEPNNQALIERLQAVEFRRKAQLSTVPSTLELELKTNPFLRTDVPDIRLKANQFAGKKLSKESDIFLSIRLRKDNFTA